LPYLNPVKNFHSPPPLLASQAAKRMLRMRLRKPSACAAAAVWYSTCEKTASVPQRKRFPTLTQ
jgi:hypothetical protein